MFVEHRTRMLRMPPSAAAPVPSATLIRPRVRRLVVFTGKLA
jgi:hypothetical protein